MVVDADDPALFDWCVATFGRMPLTVESGRVGGGRHHYYRVPAGGVVRSRNGCVGPTGAFGWKESKEDPTKGRWASKIDVKAHRAYVVAPGSRHKTGLLYTASLPITRDTILAPPVFDVRVYESLVAEWRMLPKPSTPKGSSSPGSKSSACTSDTMTVAGVAPEWIPIRAAHAAGLLLTTTALDVDEELLSRCIVLAADESREHTRAIHRGQARHCCHGPPLGYAFGRNSPRPRRPSLPRLCARAAD